ncbi:MAG TPA: DUF4105 domain-containing protein [Gemmatimonadales bacterium]|jgi:hypothetical protein|nr:DUF4105 domain-containing protein [Gemmatimonadales bacterium]
MRKLRWFLIAAAVAAAGVVMWLASRRPTNERSWSPDHALLPRATFDESRARIVGVRNFRYLTDGTVKPAYEERSYDLNRLESVWFVLVPFSTRWRAPAHSFVSFGFNDSQFVGISVEARRESHEIYSVIAGLFRRYELMYVVADERDLLLRRVLKDRNDVYVYPVRATPEKARELFVAMVRRANELAERPEFYNTITNSCTSNIVAHVNAIAPGRIPAGWRTLLPGYADEVAIELGLIDANGSVEEARRRFRVNDRAERYASDAAFSLRIREPRGSRAQ